MELRSKDLFITKDADRVPYHSREKEEKSAVHWGNRKLLLAEIAFLSLYLNPGEKSKVVYVGAAPGSHLDILAQMFPGIELHLYDPRKFVISANVPGTANYDPEKAAIYLHSGEEGFFTDKTAESWAGQDVILISDIRSAGLESKDFSAAIVSDMRAQEKWYSIMKPRIAQLKFRLPYYQKGGDKTFPYLSGLLMRGVWTPSSSTETRLIVSKPIVQNWDLEWYEDVMAHHNRVLRESTAFVNSWTKIVEPIDGPELLNDFDSAAEAFILQGYLKTVKEPATHAGEGEITREEVISVSRWITDELNGWTSIYTSFSELRKLPLGKRSTVIRQKMIKEQGLAAVGARLQKKVKVKMGETGEEQEETD